MLHVACCMLRFSDSIDRFCSFSDVVDRRFLKKFPSRCRWRQCMHFAKKES